MNELLKLYKGIEQTLLAFSRQACTCGDSYKVDPDDHMEWCSYRKSFNGDGDAKA